MNPRERILASIVGLAALLWLANVGLTRYRAALESNRTTLSELELELSQARTAVARGENARERLLNWQRFSLPTNADIANSLYQDWLHHQLTEAGLKVTDLKSTRTLQGQSDSFQEFSYTLGAQGSLRNLVGFLYRFYQAGHLHRISKATLSPTSDNRELTISLTVDALALPDSPRTAELSTEESTLELPGLDSVRLAIVDRNVFAPHTTGRSGETVARSNSNEAERARFSSLRYGDGGWQMTVKIENSNRLLYFRQGDSIRIGDLRGRIAELDGAGRRAILETRDNRVQVYLGQTLSEAQPMAEEAG